MTCHYLISFTYSRIWLKLVFLPTVSLHAAPMQKRVLPASFACQRMRICPNDAKKKMDNVQQKDFMNTSNKFDLIIGKI